MAFVYTDWPLAADVVTMLTSANLTPGAGITTDIKTLVINSAVSTFVQETGREFKPTSAGVVRYYNGTGTGRMVIDDYVTITDISYIQIPSSSVVTISNWQEVDNTPFAKNEVQIFRGPANMQLGWWSYFPIGRSNIQITGTFGYGTSIPYAVWEAVLKQAAANIADAMRITTNGILTDLHDLDQDLKWSDKQISTVTGWKDQFNQACIDWKRPLDQHRLRKKVALI